MEQDNGQGRVGCSFLLAMGAAALTFVLFSELPKKTTESLEETVKKEQISKQQFPNPKNSIEPIPYLERQITEMEERAQKGNFSGIYVERDFYLKIARAHEALARLYNPSPPPEEYLKAANWYLKAGYVKLALNAATTGHSQYNASNPKLRAEVANKFMIEGEFDIGMKLSNGVLNNPDADQSARTIAHINRAVAYFMNQDYYMAVASLSETPLRSKPGFTNLLGTNEILLKKVPRENALKALDMALGLSLPEYSNTLAWYREQLIFFKPH